MRIIKDVQLTLYLIFRYAGSEVLTDEELDAKDKGIRNFIMHDEYSFRRVSDDNAPFDLSWTNEAVEILKQERLVNGTVWPNNSVEKFYVPFSLVSADNTMEFICASLMRHHGKASVEVTIVPTEYISEEHDWLNINIKYIKDAMNGNKITDSRGAVRWRGEPIPILKNPLDNCEKMNKQFESSSLFLSSIRVYADSDVQNLANAMLTNSVRSQGQLWNFYRGDPAFDYLVNCYQNVDVSIGILTPFWQKTNNLTPFRAQRLNRLVSVEKISYFFRIPIPTKGGFPGFGYDTGLKDDFSQKRKMLSRIRLGSTRGAENPFYYPRTRKDRVSRAENAPGICE